MPRQIIRTFGLDRDTVAFAQRVKAGSGTTILPNNLIQLNKFVVGIKRMGLWNQMVCWPLRSTQNAGRGSTVYSLGGLGTFNGTMLNALTWGSNGVTSSTDTARIVTNRQLTGYTNRSLFVVAALTSTSTSNFVRGRFIGTGFSEPVYIQFNGACSGLMVSHGGFQVNGGGLVFQLGNGGPATPTNFLQIGTKTITTDAAMVGGTYQPLSAIAYNNGTQLAAGVLGSWGNTLNDTQPLWFFNSTEQLYSNNTRISFGIDFSITLTTNQTSLLYTLYRQTLGQNLGLPV
jgi:hypothetical protein